jgi:hypothetical protein
MIWTVAGFVCGGVLLGLSLLAAGAAAWSSGLGPFADWDHLRRKLGPLWPLLALWTAVYVAGQVIIWRRLSRHAFSERGV